MKTNQLYSLMLSRKIYIFIALICYTIFLHGEELKLGIDVLQESNFEILKSYEKIGVLTHKAATDSNNIFVGKIFSQASSKQLKNKLYCFFSPEHGFSGNILAGDKTEIEKYNNFTVYPLYGNDFEESSQNALKEIDVLVIDLCDIGVRCYTYITCMRYALEFCLNLGKKVIILDRPNPLGRKTSGPFIDKDLQGYVGGFLIPFIHGMTMGELANMLVNDYQKHPNLPSLKKEVLRKTLDKPLLDVVKVKNWESEKLWNEQKFKQGYVWHAPSPNIPCFESAKAYACFIACGSYGNFKTILTADKQPGTNELVQPFCFFTLHQKENVDFYQKVCDKMGKLNLPGVSFSIDYNGKDNPGIIINITDWAQFNPGLFTLKVMQLDRKLDQEKKMDNRFKFLASPRVPYSKYEEKIPFSKYFNDEKQEEYWNVSRIIIGDNEFIECLSRDKLNDEKINYFQKKWDTQCQKFEDGREKWLLY